MGYVINIIIGMVAIFHVYVMWLEMFAWTTRGPKTFKKFDKTLFEKTKSLAANQGLYNGFLAAGLIWTFFISDSTWQMNVRLFFLSCVAIAGIYGAFTADKKIFFVQGLPAIIGLALILFTPRYCDSECNKKKEPITYWYIPNKNRFDSILVTKADLMKRNQKDSLIGNS